MNDGIDYGLKTGERFGRFVYWLVTRHPADRFADEHLERMLREEFPNRDAADGFKTFQAISQHRSYAANCPDRLGVKTEAEAVEVLARIDGKMRQETVVQGNRESVTMVVSPFPGMDPFIEGQMWKDFHHELISEIRHQLVPALRPKYVPRVELRVYVERAEAPPKSIEPDVFLTAESTASARWTSRGSIAAAVAEPFLVQLPEFQDVEEPYIAIYDSEDREVVTVIEVLSPGNKRTNSAGRRAYLQMREDILKSWVNLVELDLLRGGERMPTESPLPAGDYFVLVRRAAARSQGEVYPWRLREVLPPIPVPLIEDDDVVLSLAAVFASLYDRAGYDAAVKYDRPIEPPLSEADAKWAESLVADARRSGR